MKFEELEIEIKKNYSRYLMSSVISLMLIVIFVFIGFVFAGFILSLILVLLVIVFGIFFVKSLIRLFRNHSKLIDIWDEKILVAKTLRGIK